MDHITIVQHNVLHWNTRKEELTYIYQNLNPDLIILNSHGVKDNDTIRISGYNTYMINTTGEASDGSAILIRSNIHHRQIDDYLTDVLHIKIQSSLGPIHISTTYLPPRRPYLPYPDFHKLLNNIEPLYIMGDLNAKHRFLGHTSDNQVGRGLQRFKQLNKLAHFGPNFPTYINQRSGTTPDIIVSNNRTFHNVIIEPGPLTSSDHLPVLVKITAHAIKEPTPPSLIYSRANWDKFKKVVQNQLINNEAYLEDEGIEVVDSRLENWYRAIEKGVKESIPVSKSKTIKKTLLTQEIQTLQLRFKALYRHSLTHGWNLITYRMFRNIKQQISDLCKSAINNNLHRKTQNLIANHKNPKQFWSSIRLMRGVSNRSPPYILNSNNEKIYDNKGKEKIFREIWRNNFRVSEEENEDFDYDNEEAVREFLATNLNRTLPYLHPDIRRLPNNNLVTSKISINEIKGFIKSSKGTAPGESKVNKDILLNLPDLAIEHLVTTFNLTLSMGYFPDIFKSGLLTLIPKGNKSPLNPGNYRPITLLEVPGKLLERAINRRLKYHLETQNLLPNNIHGFRDGRGTSTALAITCDLIAHALSRRDQCCLVLRDVSKAFDKVWHNGLKYKILHLGLPDVLERILCDYLNDRLVKIRMGNIIGDPINIESGVPQGGILSPTLYTVFTRDLPQPAAFCHNIIYADDISQIITYGGQSRAFMAIRVGQEIEKINTFEQKWKIKTNRSKFTIISLAKKKNDDIIVNGEIIEYKSNGTLLGLNISCKGYTQHVNKLVNKGELAIQELNMFSKLPINIKVQLVKTFILPMIEYPTIPLNTLSNTQILKIQRVQNKALRWAYNDMKYPYQKNTEQLHIESSIKPVNIKLNERAHKLWNRTGQLIDEDLAHLNEPVLRKHVWFPVTRPDTAAGTPEPLYTR